MAEADNKNIQGQTIINDEPVRPSWRDWMGLVIIILSGSVLIFLLAFAWWALACSGVERFPHVKELFGILLPLIGTWIGTVLAYYFSKDNFEAANKSVKEMIKQVTSSDEKLEEIKVSEVMIKPASGALMMVKDYDDFKSKPLSEIIEFMEKSHSERLPILQTDTQIFLFLIYRSTIDRFISEYSNNRIKLNNGKTPAIAELKVDDMISSDFNLMKEILVMKDTLDYFVSENDSLNKARQLMLDCSRCQDVFVTKTGKSDEAVIGWITNEMIAEKAELFKKARARR